MRLIDPLVDSDTKNCFDTPNCNQNLDMISLNKIKGIEPMGHSATLADSYLKKCSETENCHLHFEILS